MYQEVMCDNVFLLLDFKNKLSCKCVSLFCYLYTYVFIKLIKLSTGCFLAYFCIYLVFHYYTANYCIITQKLGGVFLGSPPPLKLVVRDRPLIFL